MTQKNTKSKPATTAATLGGARFALGLSQKFDRDFARVSAILEKATEDITGADRRELVSIYSASYHTSGKIEGITSLDSSASNCAFCEAMRAAAEGNPAHICGMCYDIAQEAYKTHALNRHSLNMVIMKSIDFTAEELAPIPLTEFVRINSSGDTPNQIYARNMIRAAYAHPWSRVAYWAKNTRDVIAACRDLGKPDNLVLVQSSPIIGRPAQRAPYFDYVFTVYPTKDATAAAISAGAQECNGRKCRDCGYKCYTGAHPAGANIAEYLRGANDDKRRRICEALEADAARTASAAAAEKGRNTVEICETLFTPAEDGGTVATFRNLITGAEASKHYRTQAAAQAQATRFANRMTRIYGAAIYGLEM